MDYKQTIEAKGFYRAGGCHCGGTVNEKYRNKDGYVIYVQPRNQKFRIKKGGIELLSYSPLTKLADELSLKIPA